MDNPRLRPFIQEGVEAHVDRGLHAVRPAQQLDGLGRARVQG